MKDLLTIIIVSILTSMGLLGQNTQTIKGRVLDALSETPLIGVNILVVTADHPMGTSTDMDGYFKIDGVPVGRHEVHMTYLGYEPRVLPNLLVQSGKELTLNVSLEESLTALDEVVVSADSDKDKAINELASVSARVMSLEEISRYSGTLGDPARMAQNFAGVSGASDDRNDIIIRGNSPTGVLWRMEGVDIPSPNHFSTLGNTGGPVSMLNINNLQNSDFLTSAFPSEYGNATSGVFDLKLRNGNYDKYEFLGQIGFNGFEGGIEGPLGIGERSSILANYRYSTLGVFKAMGLEFGTGEAVPEYQDFTFKVNVPTKSSGTFSLWAVGGLSDIEFEASENGDNNLYNEQDENSQFESNTIFGGINHTYFFSDQTFSKISLSYSGSENKGNIEKLDTEEEFIQIFGQEMSQSRYALNLKLNSKINAANRLTFGAMADLFQLHLQDSSRTISGGPFERHLNTDASTLLVRGYAHWQHRFSDDLTLNSGVYGQVLSLNQAWSVEPRLGLEYQLRPEEKLSLGLGLHSQMQPLTVYFQEGFTESGEWRSNEELDFFKSAHAVLAYDWNFSADWRLKAELYGQYLYDVAVDPEDGAFSLVNAGADFGFPTRVGLQNDGEGYNYGIELTVEKFFSSNYYVLTTASLFDSRYKGSDDVWRNSLFNSNYVFNVLGGREFHLNKKLVLTLDSKFTYTGGRRYTPIDLEASIMAGERVYEQGMEYENQYPAYVRWDVKLGIRHNAKKYSQMFFIDLQNVTGQKNVFIQEFRPRSGRVATIYQRGFFPDVRYQILF